MSVECLRILRRAWNVSFEHVGQSFWGVYVDEIWLRLHLWMQTSLADSLEARSR